MNQVEAFKNELRNYNYYCSLIRKLQEKKDDLFYELTGVKSASLESTHNSFNESVYFNKVFTLQEKIHKLDLEIERIKAQKKYITDVLKRIESKDVRMSVIEIYVQKKTVGFVAKEQNISSSGLFKQINKAINKALNPLI